MERSQLNRAGSLADLLAAAIEPREAGWRLPRRGALARKHGTSLRELDAAIGDLVRQALLRRLPDGQLYRASAAEAWVPVEGAAGLATRLDPMGNTIECQSREISRRAAPPEVAATLGLSAGSVVTCVVSRWSMDGEPAAVATAYRRDCGADEGDGGEGQRGSGADEGGSGGAGQHGGSGADERGSGAEARRPVACPFRSVSGCLRWTRPRIAGRVVAGGSVTDHFRSLSLRHARSLRAVATSCRARVAREV